MYQWKVWLRPSKPLPGWPRALDVQAFRVLPGRTVLDASRCAGNHAWRVFIGQQGDGVVHRAAGTMGIGPGEAMAVPVAEPGLRVAAGERGWSYLHVTLTDEPGDGGGFAALLADLPPVRLGEAMLARLTAWRAVYQRVLRARPADRHLTPTVPVPADEALGLAAALISALAPGAAPDSDGAAQRVVERARAVAAASRRSDLSAKELAGALAISRKHLSWAFAACGLPGPYRWLREQRMHAAAELLRGGRSATAVAAELGFADGSSFARAFHAVHGCTPTVWRRRRSDTR